MSALLRRNLLFCLDEVGNCIKNKRESSRFYQSTFNNGSKSHPVMEKKDVTAAGSSTSGTSQDNPGKCHVNKLQDIENKLSDYCIIRDEANEHKIIELDKDVCPVDSSLDTPPFVLRNGTEEDKEAHELLNKLSEIRIPEYSFYGQHLLKNDLLTSKIKNSMFSILSYNVLSQTLLENHSYLYKNHDSRALKWSYRSKTLLNELRTFNADIICLQELQSDQYDEFYNKQLTNLGYSGVYKKRTNDRVDGCGIFYKTDKFNLILFEPVEFYKPNVDILDRDNVGVIVKLSMKNDVSKQFVIGTTHLLYNTRRNDIKLAQTQLFLAEIDRIAYIDHDKLLNKPNYLPIIITGDMNYVPGSPVYQLITQGKLVYQGKSSKYLIDVNDGWQLNKTLIPAHVGVSDSCQFVSSLRSRGRHINDIVLESGTLKHNLNLVTVFDHYQDDLLEVTTNQDVWVTVDYIFYSQELGNGQDGKLKIVSRLKLPTNKDASNYLKYLPNLACASDHLPLLATFHLTS